MNKKIIKNGIISMIITLLPIFIGIIFYTKLPAEVAIHFNFNGQADGWANKTLFVFGFPILMAFFQGFTYFTYAFQINKVGRTLKMEKLYLSIFPVMIFILYPATIINALGYPLDFRRIAVFVAGILFIALGNYLPTILPQQYNAMRQGFKVKNPQKWTKKSRTSGYLVLFSGLLLLISLFFTPIFSLIALIIAIILLISVSIYMSR